MTMTPANYRIQVDAALVERLARLIALYSGHNPERWILFVPAVEREFRNALIASRPSQ